MRRFEDFWAVIVVYAVNTAVSSTPLTATVPDRHFSTCMHKNALRKVDAHVIS